MAIALGIENRVHFVGFRTDVPRFMQTADFFVFPSRYEAGTLVLIEALASGLPVITARTAGGCEIMGTNCGSILDDPDDVEGLVIAMSRFMDTSLRAKAARAARVTAEGYSWERMAQQYLACFAEFS
jgi:glycosyltransferase involved in cell wall biosynthesis